MTGSTGGIFGIILLVILPLIFAITLHEAAHGWVAKILGDKTAYLLGRVSLNPIRHIHWFGTIVLPLLMLIVSMRTMGVPFLFGWAKPVPVNWENLRNPRRDKALVAVAGPLSNIIMAFFWGLIAMVAAMGSHAGSGFGSEAATFFYNAGMYGVMINIVLGFLNLIPIPPLDGSRVVSAIIPQRWAYYYDKLEPYGIWILLALIFLGGLSYILYPPVTWAVRGIYSIFSIG
jgi:Zn-dependent protease